MRISPVRISRKTSGFTLIELIFVAFLLSLFLLFVTIRWEGFSRGGAETFLERFSLEVALLREDAISSYQERAVEIDVTNNTLNVGAFDLVKGFNVLRGIELPREYTIKDVVVNGRKISLGKSTIRFYPTGLVDRTILHLEGKKEGFFSITIHPLTAKVEARNAYIEEISLGERGNPS